MTADDLWYAQSIGARAARAMAAPMAWLYRPVVAARNALYDRGVIRVHGSIVPVVSVGNVTVGGTGKTPFSAYIVGELVALGHRPAVVMRGYGDDELHVHARLNPGIPVITGADRVAGIRAAAKAGADVVVMDDGFQHRRAHRDLDIVLVSAEKWRHNLKLLPAGPLREPLGSLRRADLIVVTQKSGTDDDIAAVVEAIRGSPHVTAGVAVAQLAPQAIVSASGGETRALESLRGERVFAIAGIGDPSSFFLQLRQLGGEVTERRYRDHYAYSSDDARKLAGESSNHKYVVTTEKDAVKLSTVWPAKSMTLWYLTQAVRLTQGASLVATALAKLFPRATSIA